MAVQVEQRDKERRDTDRVDSNEDAFYARDWS
jgi:hypothetical protein